MPGGNGVAGVQVGGLALSHATIVCEYSTPTEASGRFVPVTSVSGDVVSVNVRAPTLPSVSRASTTNANEPAASGVPARKYDRADSAVGQQRTAGLKTEARRQRRDGGQRIRPWCRRWA